ncbi:ATP-grasp domain-containing protein [Shouchella patagoniensis]|uniref:ATP-grasp domain-containing protein n=1 Tax=Shouchella patagoniensis TaxID=228576 RepID=UPI0009954761|nr:ATP-grasp domain-containing protein [Shouchella patagoniensis]
MNILLTSTSRRIDFVSMFRAAMKDCEIEGKVIVADPEHNAPSLQAGDKSYVIPHQTDPRYIDAVLDIIKENKVECLVPLNDLEVPKLAAYKNSFKELGVAVFVPELELVHKLRDKGKYRELLSHLGVKAPRSYFNVEETERALESKKVSFPLIIKPRNGSASIGVAHVYTSEELKFAYQRVLDEIKVSPLGYDCTNSTPKENIIIQEVIEGEKFSMDIFNDLEGKFLTSFIRKQLVMRGGDVDRCVIVERPDLDTIARRMGKHFGHTGYINADVFFYGEDYYVIDINPRFGGGYAFSHSAGANVPAAILSLTSGKEVKEEWLTVEANVEFARHDLVVRIDRNRETVYTNY